LKNDLGGRRIGVFGGTFNPIHLGHIGLMHGALRELQLDRLLVVPTYIPPHKLAHELASGDDRLAMCRLAAAGDPRIEVCDLELRRGGSSYTWVTLKELQKLYPGDSLFLIVGGDMLLSFRQWRRWRDILRMAVLCGAPRDRARRGQLLRAAGSLAETGRGCLVLDTPVVQVSSTAVRQALHAGQSAAGLLSPEVEQYCKQHALYQEV